MAAAATDDDDGARRGWRARVVDHSLGDAADRVVDDGRALIAAASRLIMRSGGADFTMHKVAAEAGVSRRVLYRLFGGRDDLIAALLEESNAVYARRLIERVARFDDPLEQLAEALYFASDPRQLTDTRYNAAMITISVEAAVRMPRALRASHRPLLDAFAQLCAAAISAGHVRAAPPSSHARMLVLLLTAYQQTMFLQAGGQFDHARQREFVEFCLAGLGASIEDGWLERFELDDAEAEASRHRTAEMSAAIRTGGNNDLIDENGTFV